MVYRQFSGFGVAQKHTDQKQKQRQDVFRRRWRHGRTPRRSQWLQRGSLPKIRRRLLSGRAAQPKEKTPLRMRKLPIKRVRALQVFIRRIKISTALWKHVHCNNIYRTNMRRHVHQPCPFLLACRWTPWYCDACPILTCWLNKQVLGFCQQSMSVGKRQFVKIEFWNSNRKCNVINVQARPLVVEEFHCLSLSLRMHRSYLLYSAWSFLASPSSLQGPLPKTIL